MKIEKQLQFAGSTQIVCYDYLGQYTWNQQGVFDWRPYGGLKWDYPFGIQPTLLAYTNFSIRLMLIILHFNIQL